jgi:Cysteine-rich domain
VVHGNNLGDQVAMHKLMAKSGGTLVYHGQDAEMKLGGRRVFATHFPHYGRGMACTGDYDLVCCGGALAFSEPDKSQKQIRDIVESAYDHGAEMIVTPCQLCQANVEIYQSEINKKKGTKLAMPVVYYSQLMTVAYGGRLKEAGLDGHVIQPERLQKIAERNK